MNKICVVTGTRADYGLLQPLLDNLQQEESLQLQIIATGMHLSPEFSLTYEAIEADGFHIDDRIEILLSSDTAVGISKSMGLAMIGFGESYARLRPDMVIVLGDRYEAFAAASAATIANIPIAHIHGGETTQGAFDEAFRHSITKMSYLHFTSTEVYRNRVIQLGESPDRVFNVGALGVENINNMQLLSKTELEQQIGFEFGLKTALVTFHPVTLEQQTVEQQFEQLLLALDEFDDLKVIFTKANSDTDGRLVNKRIDEYAKERGDKVIAFTSMGQLRYLSAMQYVDVVIGNSSSGIIEAPSLRVPSLNIGDRQKGRLQAESIINCSADKKAIAAALNQALSAACMEAARLVVNPYEQANTSGCILAELKNALSTGIDIKKPFHDL